MHFIELTGPSIDQLVRREGPAPSAPRRGEVLVRMRAASFNYLDLAVATGSYPGIDYPLIPIADGAGEVVAVGEDVEDLSVGDRVAVHPKAWWIEGPGTAATVNPMRGANLPGALVEVATADAESVVKAPDYLSYSAIATLPIAATTAWRAVDAGDLKPGSTVLLLGTGGVSIFALQFAKARGARVIILSSSDEKLERVRSIGADETINYRRIPAWDETVLDLTDGLGVDLVVETVGGDTFGRSIAAVRQNGAVVTIGFLGGIATSLDLLPVIGKAVRIQGSTTGSVADLRRATAALASHRIEPVIDRTFPLEDIAEGYAALGAAQHFGKLAIDLIW